VTIEPTLSSFIHFLIVQLRRWCVLLLFAFIDWTRDGDWRASVCEESTRKDGVEDRNCPFALPSSSWPRLAEHGHSQKHGRNRPSCWWAPVQFCVPMDGWSHLLMRWIDDNLLVRILSRYLVENGRFFRTAKTPPDSGTVFFGLFTAILSRERCSGHKGFAVVFYLQFSY
jgi:hypothetical protein